MTKQEYPLRLCRRRLCQRALAAALALPILPGRGRARSYKMTKKQAGYKLKDKDATQTCAQCTFFVIPHDCVLVEGPVSPNGWCTYYGD